jgi:hypothetical protein
MDKIRNEDAKRELGVLLVNDKIKGYREDWLERVERTEGRVPKQDVWYRRGRNKNPGTP